MSAKNKDDPHRTGQLGFLLIHGLFGAPAEMRFVADGLAQGGHIVHCVKLAGHCGSLNDLRSTTWQDWYSSAEVALEEMRKSCDRIIVAGQSTGALLSLLLAANRPSDVTALALYAPTLWLNGWRVPWYARLLKLVRFKALGNLISLPDLYPHGIKDQRTREFVRKSFSPGDIGRPAGAVLEHRWLVSAVKRVMASVTQRVLIIHSRQDDFADLSNATYLQRTLTGMVDVVVLDDSYHLVTVDRQRHVVVNRTLDFASRVATEPARKPRILELNLDVRQRRRQATCYSSNSRSRRVAG